MVIAIAKLPGCFLYVEMEHGPPCTDRVQMELRQSSPCLDQVRT